MRFIQHYSSSAGNLYEVVNASGKRLLLECGVPWKKIQKALNYDLSNIVGACITHEHMDHCKAIHEVMAAGINCYMSPGTRESLKLTTHRRAYTLGPSAICLSSDGELHFRVAAYDANHDARQASIFVVKTGGESLLFAPDTSHITQRFRTPFNIIALECSFDGPTLAARVDAGTINESLAKRLLTSHQEKSVTMKYLAEYCDLSQCREIHLLHMSSDNIDKEATRKEFEERFMVPVIITGERQCIA